MKKYKKVRTLKDIQNDERVDEIYNEDDNGDRSWWCHIKYGFMYDCNSHTIHEDTLKLVCDALNNHVKVWHEDPELKNREPWGFCETPEEECTMNYCDNNGCQNRKRNYVEGNNPTLDTLNF